jgi:catechol 2,3-dioxygenase-like lactoylglutathione lyase family enzyme
VPGEDGVRRIHHVGITVADLDRSLVFYRDLLGMAVLGRSDDEDVGVIVGLPGARVVRRAETIEDVFRRDLGFLSGDPADRQRQHAGE